MGVSGVGMMVLWAKLSQSVRGRAPSGFRGDHSTRNSDGLLVIFTQAFFTREHLEIRGGHRNSFRMDIVQRSGSFEALEIPLTWTDLYGRFPLLWRSKCSIYHGFIFFLNRHDLIWHVSNRKLLHPWQVSTQKYAVICITSSTNWWFQPIWKTLVKLDHFPR